MGIFSGESLEVKLARKKAELSYLVAINKANDQIPFHLMEQTRKAHGEVAALEEKIKMRHSSATG